MSICPSLWDDSMSLFELDEDLLCSNDQLGSLEESKMDDPLINGFIELFKAAYKERDEARQELQKSVAKVRQLQELLNRISQAAAAKIIPTVSQVQSVVSDYVCETNNSQGSSSVESSDRKIRIGGIPVIDTEGARIEELAKGPSLPEKGKLREAVMNAGPLMATLVQPFPLPTWRNLLAFLLESFLALSTAKLTQSVVDI